MTLYIHRVAVSTAFMCISTFFLATVIAEFLGSYETIAEVKKLIVRPGLFIFVPSMIISGVSGFLLAKSRNGKFIQQKKKRMPFIAANGVLILIPCAIFLAQKSSSGIFDVPFYTVQIIELLAGATNLILLSMSMRDGLKTSGKYRAFVTINQ